MEKICSPRDRGRPTSAPDTADIAVTRIPSGGLGKRMCAVSVLTHLSRTLGLSHTISLVWITGVMVV